MKIVALHTDFRIYWPARLNALSEALTSRGDSLEVIEIAGKGSPYAFAKNQNESYSLLKWHILFPEAKPEELTGKQIEPVLFHMLDDINPDVIIAGAIAFPSGALAVRWGQLHKTRIISFDDQPIGSLQRSPLVNFIKQQVYNGIDAMFYSSEDLIPTGEFWKFNQDQMFFGVDVVDNNFWNQPTDSSNTLGRYFLTVGRQIPRKNLSTLMKAYTSYVNAVGPYEAINLVLTGEGEEQEMLRSNATWHGLDKKVTFLPFKPQQELVGLYQQAEALCMPSKSETWGLVINEAMAAGCPVIASNQCGATGVLVEDGVNGYRFDCEDVAALTDCMKKFHSLTPEQKQRMKAHAKKTISHWGLNKFSSSLLQAIDYVTSHKKRPTSLVSRIIISKWKGQYRPV